MIVETTPQSENNPYSDDSCSQKSSNSSGVKAEFKSGGGIQIGEQVSAIKRADEEEAEEISCNV